MIANDLKKRIYTSLVLLISVFLIFKFNLILVYFLIILGVLSILEFLELTRKIFISKTYLSIVNIFFILYISIFCLMFFFFSNLAGLKIILLFFLIGCITSDIGGFLFGKLFKGPKLTRISPKKTFSGAMGSLISTAIIVSFLFFYFLQSFNLKIIIIALMTSVFCQIGDLIFSFLKRKAKLKNTGKILPGHGGILDRLDGILLGIPLGFLTLVLLN